MKTLTLNLKQVFFEEFLAGTKSHDPRTLIREITIGSSGNILIEKKTR